jgi:serine/threonine-protein kinase
MGILDRLRYLIRRTIPDGEAGVSRPPDDPTPLTQLIETAPSYIGVRLKERYEITSELGRGAIGVVYLAVDRDVHDRPVVVKALQGDSLRNEWLAKKFHHESEALSRIDHPGVVKVIDRGRTPTGGPFFVMEFVKGQTLRERIDSTGLPLDDAARIVEQIGQALGAAHEAGVFHRDLKPENIMLQARGLPQLKLIDFGIAKVQDPNSTTGTVGTVTAGTLLYMSPEQLERGEASAASDIYAMGVIAYEALTGRLPYAPKAPTQLALMNELVRLQRAGAFMRPSHLRPELTPLVEEALLKALAFDPERRFQSAEDFGDVLAGAIRAAAAKSKPGGLLGESEAPTIVVPDGDVTMADVAASGGHDDKLAVSRRDVGAVTVLSLEGFLDAHTAPILERVMQQVLADGKSRILANCAALTYIASAGLGVFMSRLPVARERDGDIKLCAVAPSVFHTFELLGLHHLFEIVTTESEALAKFTR